MFEEESKDSIIKMRVSATEKALIEYLAKAENNPVSNYIRKKLYAGMSQDDLNDALRKIDPNTNKTVTREDLEFGENTGTKSIAIQMTNEEIAEIDRLSAEAGVPRAVFLRNRIKEGKQIFLNINLNVDDIEELIAETRLMNQKCDNILKTMTRANGVFSMKEKQMVMENNLKIEQNTSRYLSDMKLLQIKVNETARKVAKDIVRKQRKKDRG